MRGLCSTAVVMSLQVFLDSEWPCGSGLYNVFSHCMYRKGWSKQPEIFTSVDFQLYPTVGIMSLANNGPFGIMPTTHHP